MKLSLARFIFLFSFLFIYTCSNAQEPAVIKVKKESDLVKAVFDNTEYRLTAVDRFGNPRENKIVSYKLWIKGNGSSQPYQGFNNSLSPEMLKDLRKLKKTTKIFFTDINVKDDDDHALKLPDVIDTWFPDCKNCDNRKSGY